MIMSIKVPIDPRIMSDGMRGRTPEGQLSKLISCTLIPEGHIRGAYKHNNKMYAITGAMYGPPGGMRAAYAQVLVPLEQYEGQIYTYNEKSGTDIRGEQFYTGIKVRCNGTWFVLGDEQLQFVPGERDSRFDVLKQMALF
jgi:hypothetical protein